MISSRYLILIVALLLLAALPALGGGAGTTRYVATDGSNANSGLSPDQALASIQLAYLFSAAGDTVRVFPGTYDECVRANGIFAGENFVAEKAVHFIAEDWDDMDPDNTTTIIEGTTFCGALSATPGPTVIIAGTDASIEGFTITAGGNGGVFATGPVSITNNVIRDNVGDEGGGINAYPGVCDYGDSTVTITGNDVVDNVANFDGGGIHVTAVSFDGVGGCSDGVATIQIDQNLISGNKAAADGFGGGLYAKLDSNPSATGSITITQNTITGNQLDPTIPISGNTVWGGGGAWVSTYGYGTETITMSGNQITNNSSTLDGGGLSTWMQTFEEARHTILLDGNTVTGNIADGNGGGMDLFLFADDLFTGGVQSVSFQVNNNTISNNRANSQGGSGGGGGVLVNFFSDRTIAADLAAMEFSFSKNIISNNTAELNGGGLSAIIVAEADPDFSPDPNDVSPAEATLELSNNLIVSNTAGVGLDEAFGGGVFSYLQAFGPATAELDTKLNTVADNLTEFGAGGFELEQSAGLDTADVGMGVNNVRINSSVVLDNEGYAIGGPGDGDAGIITGGGSDYNLVLFVDYCDLYGNDIDGVEPTLPQNNLDFITEDPLFDINYIAQDCSPTIDSGDPTFDFSDEPAPNGDRVNMGDTGGTDQATRGFADLNGDGVVDGIDLVRMSVAFGAFAGQPRYSSAADFDQNLQVDGNDVALVAADFGRICP